MTLRLQSGVVLTVSNNSIAQQYLKYGAVEVVEPIIEEPIVEKTEEIATPKRTNRKKN